MAGLSQANRHGSRHIVWLTSWVSGGDYTDIFNVRKPCGLDSAHFLSSAGLGSPR